MNSVHSCWAIIPAAGKGTRIGSDVPKQYLKLNGKSVLEYSIDLFTGHPAIQGTVVVLAGDDTLWEDLKISQNDTLLTVTGGKERFHSVLNGLSALEDRLNDDDWVLVHDAARPCLENGDIDSLLNTLSSHPVGGILAIPARDTMKRSEEGNAITGTVDRNGLWHALTPQMFRYKKLRVAIEKAISKNINLTDEAQAMEITGEQPLLVEGSVRNIKITTPDDLELAAYYLSQMRT